MSAWKITQGSARATVQAPDYQAARDRASAIGFKAPDSVVLIDPDPERQAELAAELLAEWRADDRETA